MSDEEREAIRKPGAEDARRSRTEHGFLETVLDCARSLIAHGVA
jgi:hypothetical protein